MWVWSVPSPANPVLGFQSLIQHGWTNATSRVEIESHMCDAPDRGVSWRAGSTTDEKNEIHTSTRRASISEDDSAGNWEPRLRYVYANIFMQPCAMHRVYVSAEGQLLSMRTRELSFWACFRPGAKLRESKRAHSSWDSCLAVRRRMDTAGKSRGWRMTHARCRIQQPHSLSRDETA